MFTLVLFIQMTNASFIEVKVPGFESLEACKQAASQHKTSGLSTIVLMSSGRCVAQ